VGDQCLVRLHQLAHLDAVPHVVRPLARDIRTWVMLTLPLSHSHASIDPAVRAARNLPEDLIRLCVGIEDPADLIDDLEAALLEAGAVRTVDEASSALRGERLSLERTGAVRGDGLVRELEGLGLKSEEGRSDQPKVETIMTSAPGKVILFGEHAVVHGVVRSTFCSPHAAFVWSLAQDVGADPFLRSLPTDRDRGRDRLAVLLPRRSSRRRTLVARPPRHGLLANVGSRLPPVGQSRAVPSPSLERAQIGAERRFRPRPRVAHVAREPVHHTGRRCGRARVEGGPVGAGVLVPVHARRERDGTPTGADLHDPGGLARLGRTRLVRRLLRLGIERSALLARRPPRTCALITVIRRGRPGTRPPRQRVGLCRRKGPARQPLGSRQHRLGARRRDRVPPRNLGPTGTEPEELERVRRDPVLDHGYQGPEGYEDARGGRRAEKARGE
jgi:hypothetical protein